jgi:hypothetical protein
VLLDSDSMASCHELVMNILSFLYYLFLICSPRKALKVPISSLAGGALQPTGDELRIKYEKALPCFQAGFTVWPYRNHHVPD